MPSSYNTYPGDGSTTVFNIGFDYLARAHVYVFVDTVPVQFTFNTASTVSLAEAPADGSVVRIQRTTDTSPLVDFANGETLTEANLDRINRQGLFIAEETADRSSGTLQIDTDNTWNAGGHRIKNVADPVNDDEVVTKGWMRETINADALVISGYADDAETARDEAVLAASAAKASETAAETAANSADEDAARAAVDAAAAGQSAASAGFSDTTAAQSAADAADSAAVAVTSETTAVDAAVSANGSAASALNSANAANTSAEEASSSASAALNRANQAQSSASDAASSASAALNRANQAQSSASDAASSAAAAQEAAQEASAGVDWSNVDITGGTASNLLHTTALRVEGNGNILNYFRSLDGRAAQLRLVSDSSNRRIVSQRADGSVMSQIELLDNSMSFSGADTTASGDKFFTANTKGVFTRNTPQFWGAAGDGVSDDSSAIRDCLNYCVDNNLTMVVPAGRYRMNSHVRIVRTGNPIRTGIIGEGMGVSVFVAGPTNTEGCFTIDVTGTANQSDRAVFRDFSIHGEARGGNALRFRQYLSGGNQDINAVVCTNVHIGVDITSENYFDAAFDFSGCWRPLIDGCFWAGPTWGYDRDPSDAALSCAVGINVTGAYDPIISRCWVKGCQIGLRSVDTTGGNESEALRVTDCVFNHVQYGIYVVRSTREPLLMVDRTHINYTVSGIEVDGMRSGQITNCLIYNEDSGQLGHAGIATDINLKNSSEMIVANNIFAFPGNPNRTAVYVQADGENAFSGAGHNIIIHSNIIQGTFSTAIRFLAGTNNCKAINNMFSPAPGTITNNYSDDGTNNIQTGW